MDLIFLLILIIIQVTAILNLIVTWAVVKKISGLSSIDYQMYMWLKEAKERVDSKKNQDKKD